MSSHWCGAKSGCKRGQYLCPSDSRTCVDSAADYAKCPGIKGTHLDWTLGTEARLDFLVAHTSLSAQIGQLHNTAPELLELGVPEYQWLNDDQHGVARTPARATVFPNGVGLGATFSHATLRAVGAVVGREARGLHNGFLASDPRRRQMTCNGCGLTLYAPNLNLVRDPRWGRAQEVYGEDPTHMGELVVEFVRGAQNNTAGRTDADGYLQAGTCCKHVAVYNTEGVPTCGSRGLLTAVLRETWRWDGFVVSDYDAWANIALAHHYNATLRAGAAQGLNAGIDQEGGSALAISTLPAAIRDGLTTPAAVARAFRNLFRLRIRRGAARPSRPPRAHPSAPEVGPRRHLAVAREAALELMTLLENKGRALPRSTAQGGAFSLTALSARFGNWGLSLEAALRERLGGGTVTAARGLDAIGAPESRDGFRAAAAAAASADATVVVLGLAFDQYCHGDDDGLGDHCEREGFPAGNDRRIIELPLGQQRMVAALRAATAGPLVCLLVHGGAIAIDNATRAACDAVLDAWYPGIEGGAAVAATLFGDAGRTPVTFYRATADLPPLADTGMYPNASSGSRGATYRFFEGAPLYPFGHGLSYTTFAYSSLSLDAASHSACDAVGVTVTVTNTGSVASDEVVQVYLKQPDATVPAPRVRLGAFERIKRLAPGASIAVKLSVPPEARAVVHGGEATGEAVFAASAGVTLEKGRLEIFVGGGQPDFFKGRLAATTSIVDTKRASACAAQQDT
ncbi:hypothetical protein EMIHUDRAFT_248116 [Emiliania huxleyi CCMP1516]|uniref:Fibronectin type III-like domain-containing protein n=2 Tax=Emiliania huxleyi TaxID=2903 RepID=A0A0D3IID9_EMIH1|nr:hypothetical protein EMIHUDRAFT_248116 [Emiliania huxleyi CCMP1516]EOD11024.1 hypothetical protein EMIHUDRAFT_248116 [Emiliania huxleyi CCMP1516]|eukprot:XP_005763453.1 hypothetical protein EMIHUDRAFT_248116 [Emiliania huxleyi CCMP1516]